MRKCHLVKVSLVAALIAPPAIAATIPDGMQWGVTFGFYATNGYFGSVEAKAEIDAIARAGATWVTVVPTVWQDTCSSSFQYKDFALTPNDIELMEMGPALTEARGRDARTGPRARLHLPRKESRGCLPALGDKVTTTAGSCP